MACRLLLTLLPCRLLFFVVSAHSLVCHFCLHSVKTKDAAEGENQNPDCMNRLRFGSREELRRSCAPLEDYCASTVTNLNGFFVQVERDCVEECIPGCEGHGFGLFWSECTRCCNSSLCNEWDGRAYYMPNLSYSYSHSILLMFIFFSSLTISNISSF